MWRSLARHAGIPNFLSIPKSVLYKRLKETYNLDRLQRAEARKRQGSSFRRENLTLRRQRMKESQLTDEPPSVHFSKTGWDGLPTSSSSGGASSSSSSSSSSSLSSSSSSSSAASSVSAALCDDHSENLPPAQSASHVSSRHTPIEILSVPLLESNMLFKQAMKEKLDNLTKKISPRGVEKEKKADRVIELDPIMLTELDTKYIWKYTRLNGVYDYKSPSLCSL
jgi:hypothetical protein